MEIKCIRLGLQSGFTFRMQPGQKPHETPNCEIGDIKNLWIESKTDSSAAVFMYAPPRLILNSSCSLSFSKVLTKELPTHSLTFPYMSYKFQEFGYFCPTDEFSFLLFPRNHPYLCNSEASSPK